MLTKYGRVKFRRQGNCLLLSLVCVVTGLVVCRGQDVPRKVSNCQALLSSSSTVQITSKVRGEFLKNGRKTLVQDLYLRSQDGSQTRAFLIKPYKPVAKQGGAAFFVHLLGAPPDNDRTEFFEDALELADSNVTSLLVEAPWADPEWFPSRKLEEDLPNVLKYVSELEGQFNFLLAESKAPPEKVALVGHDFGAMYGVLMLKNQESPKRSNIGRRCRPSLRLDTCVVPRSSMFFSSLLRLTDLSVASRLMTLSKARPRKKRSGGIQQVMSCRSLHGRIESPG